MLQEITMDIMSIADQLFSFFIRKQNNAYFLCRCWQNQPKYDIFGSQRYDNSTRVNRYNHLYMSYNN